MKNPIETLLFDLDDTLILERRSAENSFIETIQQGGLLIPPERFLKTIFGEARKQWHQLPTIEYCRHIGISSWEGLWADFTGEDESLGILREKAHQYRFQTWNTTLQHFGIHNEKLAERLASAFRKIRNSKHILYPETEEVLSELQQHYKLGLITNGTPDLQWKKIKGGRLQKYFRFIAISGEQGYAKPDKRIFDLVIRELDTKKEQSIMIGDSLKSDIKGGLASGLKTIWINREGKVQENVHPDYEISNLSALKEILAGYNPG